MPLETKIGLAAILFVYAAFALAMLWADFYARNERARGAQRFFREETPESDENRPAAKHSGTHRKAA